MRNVLVALKDRGHAVRLATLAAALAGPGAHVSVVHIVEVPSRGYFASADLAVAEAVEVLRAHRITARGHVDVLGDGGVVGGLTERVRASGADAVVMGSRGLGEVSGLIAGSISHALPAELDLPVLILPDRSHVPEHGLRRVLAAVGSEDDAEVAAAAAQQLGDQAIEVLAVHVPRRLALHVGAAVTDLFLELGETSSAVLATALERFEQAGQRLATRTVCRVGGTAATICEAARDWNADVIILGSHRPRAWGALTAGSTSHDVLRHSDRPVLVAGRRRGQPCSPGVPVWRAGYAAASDRRRTSSLERMVET
jgi:nucleotide-binding universal stress UspA family protein